MCTLKWTPLLWLFIFKCGASEDSRPVKVKPGDDVTLPCRGSRAANIIVLKWIRPDLKSEGFVYFFRDEHSYKSYQHPSFHSRVELRDSEMKDGDVSVILRNVSIIDAGTYECHVGYGSSPELISSINLKVEDVDSQELTVRPGDDVPLHCRGPRDGDVIMLSWIRPDLRSEGFVFFVREKRSYEKYQLPSFHGRVELRDPEMKDGDFTVILKNVSVDDAGTYECHVGKSNTGSSKTHTPEHMSIVYLKVEDSGPTAGNIRVGGDKEVGVVVALWVSVVAALFFCCFRLFLLDKKTSCSTTNHHLSADNTCLRYVFYSIIYDCTHGV
ncbi:Myelin-oligodendrocyte glycoprotein Precursor [Channa argus]|uniref:Myelin-oligodendrocyte glycoprotein n=1 Tax=Channa argus TaxID=215402 RepID=A0A6G1Q7G8_CHAAH|nr:Myelin-oligodendrocyte glycoprotein Precursor [Channa argus]